MKKIFTAALLSLSMIGIVVGQKQDFQLDFNGQIHSSEAKVFVRYFVGQKLKIDSVSLKSSNVTYKGQIDEPMQVMLFYSKDGASFFNKKGGPMQRLTFYVDPLEANTEIAIKDPFESSIVKGGQLQVAYKKYQDYLRPYEKQLVALQSRRSDLYQDKNRNEEAMKQVSTEVEKQNELRVQAQRKFIVENPDNYFSLLALQEVARYGSDVSLIEPMFLKLSANLRKTAIGEKLEGEILLAKKLGIGQPAPDFGQLTPDGRLLKLSDFKGKYVLLDFWASWCGPCRAENPHLVEIYKQFKGPAFEILGISLDKPGKKDNWTKAIEQDGLKWPQVSDLNGWQNNAAQLYGVQAIPQNYLISPEGKIVGINLKGKQLADKLAELIK
ncbi:TlpA disulfide reductase family protein [Sphingobacterium athyrii]|uniref:Alkyl hydroperoxide reductase n=1 Tax=Sphingobacterium athyrii TaxID=2152717 RepID=A0A363NT82_9SPHI|nr:TlpA disulfide reductase family protein [Sphingobacterium athyrii]PUV24025.1 alkyl hydroperoxide reductase [Sphingobacterium athyrii]